MLRTGDQYRDSLRDGREVWVDGEKVNDVSSHPVFKPIVDIRARIYDMAHEEKFSENLTYTDEKSNEKNCIGSKLPKSKNDWLLKREAIKIHILQSFYLSVQWYLLQYMFFDCLQ